MILQFTRSVINIRARGKCLVIWWWSPALQTGLSVLHLLCFKCLRMLRICHYLFNYLFNVYLFTELLVCCSVDWIVLFLALWSQGWWRMRLFVVSGIPRCNDFCRYWNEWTAGIQVDLWTRHRLRRCWSYWRPWTTTVPCTWSWLQECDDPSSEWSATVQGSTPTNACSRTTDAARLALSQWLPIAVHLTSLGRLQCPSKAMADWSHCSSEIRGSFVN